MYPPIYVRMLLSTEPFSLVRQFKAGKVIFDVSVELMAEVLRLDHSSLKTPVDDSESIVLAN